jgi:hypothetical protein
MIYASSAGERRRTGIGYPMDQYRSLIQVTDNEFWESLPKHVRAFPVYFRRTKDGGMEFWPNWPEYVVNFYIGVKP